MASEQLRELRELERQLQSEGDLGEIQPEREIKLGAGSFRVADGSELENEERKTLLRRQAAAKERAQSGLESWKVWVVVGVTVLSCIALLWALFSGGTPDKFEESAITSHAMTASELHESHAAGERDSGCPDSWWLPEECLGAQRLRSKTALERCNKIFADLEYSLDMLIKCGTIVAGD